MVEAPLQLGLDPREDREIVLVLDIVVPIEMAEEKVEARREKLREFLRRRAALAIVGYRARQDPAQFAKHVVPLRHMRAMPVHIGMGIPAVARIFRQQIFQILGQAGALLEQQDVRCGGQGGLPGQGFWIAHRLPPVPCQADAC